MKTNQMRKAKTLFRAAHICGVSPCHLHLTDTQRHVEEWGCSIMEQGQFPGALMEAVTWGSFRQANQKMGILGGGECAFGFLQLVLRWKQGQHLGS